MLTETDLIEKDIEAYLDGYRRRELLRFLTCGSVDDGKSTLIGRLLHDSQMIYEDQLAAVKRDSVKHGTTGDEIDFALLTDGLKAEREQGITIDVAYRYFSTAKRKFIIADTPGHEQYTRNMATGASTCDLAVILVDARNGVLSQTRRHSFIASLLGITRIVVAINKMDLVGYAQDVYEKIRAEYADFAAKLQTRDVHFIPLSALKGDNVVDPSTNMPWYRGAPLLDYLENVHIAGDRNLIDLRFPVQYVLRSGTGAEFRGYCGTVVSGVIRAGDEIMALPSGRRSHVRSLLSYDGEQSEAFPPMAVTVTLTDELDISRGDMLVHVNNLPRVEHTFEAMMVWMNEQPLETGRPYLIKHTTLTTEATVTDLRYRMNVNTLHREQADGLELNEIGRVCLETTRPLHHDPYAKNRATGAFVIIDRITNATLGAGMILDRGPGEPGKPSPERRRIPAEARADVFPRRSRITTEQRAARLNQRPFTVWLTGLPKSGKSSIAFGLEEQLFAQGFTAHVLDGANLRLGIARDLDFSGPDRAENVRRAAEVARLCNDLGLITIAALVSPRTADRAAAREIIGAERFVEVHCDAPVETCEARDEDGLYARARAGEIQGFTGVDAPYEPPPSPTIALDTAHQDVTESVQVVMDALRQRGFLAAR